MDMQITQEKHASKIAAIFDDKNIAHNAKKTLIEQGGFSSRSIKIIHPHDQKASRKVEPEVNAIFGVLKQSHYILGAAGLVAGVALAGGLSIFGPDFIQSSPILSMFAFGLIGTFLGMILAGAVTLRPDHDPVINEALEASEHEQWAVVVHTEGHEGLERARKLLEPIAVDVTKSF